MGDEPNMHAAPAAQCGDPVEELIPKRGYVAPADLVVSIEVSCTRLWSDRSVEHRRDPRDRSKAEVEKRPLRAAIPVGEYVNGLVELSQVARRSWEVRRRSIDALQAFLRTEHEEIRDIAQQCRLA